MNTIWNSHFSVYKVLLKHGHTLVYVQPMAASTPEQQSWLVVTEAVCPQKPKIFTICPLPKKACGFLFPDPVKTYTVNTATWRARWERKWDVGKTTVCVHPLSFQFSANRASLAEQQGGELSGQISHHLWHCCEHKSLYYLDLTIFKNPKSPQHESTNHRAATRQEGPRPAVQILGDKSNSGLSFQLSLTLFSSHDSLMV